MRSHRTNQQWRLLSPFAIVTGILLLVAIATIIPSSEASNKQQAYGQSQTTLNGAGATFPFPLIDTWRVEYQEQNPGVNINYQSIGSGGGIRQFTEMTVDFGASDAPLTAAQRENLRGTTVHVPETIGSVVAAYNLPEVREKGLKLTGPILADIFLSKITKWDDQRIKEINPDLQLPSRDITVVHRSDGSGTTFIWTSYLSLVNHEWEQNVGKGTAVQWPTGIGAPGNEGVANSIKTSPYTIGYIELAYALTTKMPYAFLQNRDGSNFVEPSLDSTRNAVENLATTLPEGEDSWENVSLLNAPGENSYPIASFSYILLYRDMSTNPNTSQQEAEEIVRFVSWAVTEGQQYADELAYVPLPQLVIDHNLETLRSLTYGDTSLAAVVVPEFAVIIALVLAASLVGVIAYVRLINRGNAVFNSGGSPAI